MRIAPILTIVALAAGAAGGYAYWLKEQALRVPPGLVRANGRVEVERVDVAAKYAGRIAELRVNEGATIEKDDILARIDTTEIVAQLAGAKAAVHRAHQSVARAQADVALREAELKLAEVELKRGLELVRTNAITQADFDRRTAQRDISSATLEGAKVAIEDGKAATEVAEAQVAQIEASIADMTLKAPVSGRVEYRLAQAGEVVGAGGRVLTLLFPATVSFVAGEAQFTPKYVETANEREKLMYRIKLHIDPQLLKTYRGYVKAGMTGNAFFLAPASPIFLALPAHRLAQRVLRLQPRPRGPAPIRRIDPLGHDALKAHPAGVLEHDRAIVMCQMLVEPEGTVSLA
jgi:HlyD family secretion protein